MLEKSFFKDKRVTVFGLGLNGGGVATVRFLAGVGVREIIVTDIKTRAELDSSLRALRHIKNLTLVLGQHRPEDFTHTDMVIINPGIAWTNEYVRLALARNIPVEMDASIFFQLCPCPIIGVTGTKGKTTTATLLAHILKTAGNDAVMVGIGQTPVLDALANVKKASVVVFELSSWRLSSIARIQKSPHIAVFTNIFPDHLNYYRTMEAYLKDKSAIFAFQGTRDWLVLNQDNDAVLSSAQGADSKRLCFSEHARATENGVFCENGNIVFFQGGAAETLMPLLEIPLRGKHNIGNVLAAIGAAKVFGVDSHRIRKAVKSFPGIRHRLEFIRSVRGIAYYNDSAATVPEAAVNALESFAEPIILIAGGNNKGLNFDALAKALVKRTKKTILFQGEATEHLLKVLRRLLPEEKMKEIEMVDSMAKAVTLAASSAVSGDVILLSPGATSFGLFQNEFDRGDQFCDAVRSL